MPRIFIVYKNRLFNDILASVHKNTVGAAERATTPLDAIVDAINSARPNVIIIESEADGDVAWHIVRACRDARRVIVLDMDWGAISEYQVRASHVDTLEELSEFIEAK